MSEASDFSKDIDLVAFGRLVGRLKEALAAYDSDPANLFALDSTIKRYELTYELAVRNMRRFLIDQAISPPEIQALSFQDLIREADKAGLLEHGWPEWKRFRDARNETVHAYREDKAREVVGEAKVFLPEAERLLENLQRRYGSNG